jgi:hypothetical protein
MLCLRGVLCDAGLVQRLVLGVGFGLVFVEWNTWQCVMCSLQAVAVLGSAFMGLCLSLSHVVAGVGFVLNAPPSSLVRPLLKLATCRRLAPCCSTQTWCLPA